jgi:hypothetical protein
MLLSLTMGEEPDGLRPSRVFVSYSHGSGAHVLFEDAADAVPLQLVDVMRYRLPGDYEALYRRLTNQPEVVLGDLGPLRKLDGSRPVALPARSVASLPRLVIRQGARPALGGMGSEGAPEPLVIIERARSELKELQADFQEPQVDFKRLS